MKFSWKIFLCVITITCVTFSLGGFFLISSWFYDSLRREIQFAQRLGIPIRQWEPEAGMERGLSL